MADSALTLPRLGRYTLLSEIAHGGMAEVYLATQDGPQGFQKIVVIKRILPHLAKEAEFVRMFLDEARLAALINHPNVVSIFELGEEPETGGYFMAMEYIDGRNLREVADIARRGRRPLAPRLSARVIADACAGLHYAHELTRPGSGEPLRIVHRDISPENLLVTYGGLVKVVDFGIAKAAQSENLTKTGQVKGKLSYLSPEQLQGRKVDRRADLWSLGVTLYWLLTGEKPFKGDSEAHIMRAVLEATPAPLGRRGRDSLAAFQPILNRALAKDPAQRYPTALAMQDDLERLLAEEDKPTTSAAVGATMEKLFPKATDPERIRHRQILKNEPVEEISLSLTPEREVRVRRRSRAPWLALLTVLAIAAVAVVARETLQRVAGTEPTSTVADAAVAPKSDASTVQQTPAAPTLVAPPSAASDDAGDDSSKAVSTTSGGLRPTTAPAVTASPEPIHAPGPAHHPGPPGFLSVQGRGGLTVLVDGVRVGLSPLPRLHIAAGHHRVELIDQRSPLHGEHRTLQIDVRSGQLTVVR